jgi:predicted KAP-like P-loop ATPase
MQGMQFFKHLAFFRKYAELSHPQVPVSPTGASVSIQVDKPIESARDDLFDRAPFAAQIANVIGRRSDPSSLVIGVYGPWGDGKTSTLSMIKEHLEPEQNILTLDYNPWYYGADTEAITRSFFKSIKQSLERSGWFSKEKIGELMASYGGTIPKLGDAVQKVGQAMTTEELTLTRDKLGAILRQHGKRIVIFIDDIDRLDRADMQTLFKLVRLSGGFDNTTYVVAFDDAVVAEALGSAYGAGDQDAGRRFLEKIVQIPLHLPPANSDKLRELMFRSCDRVAIENGIEMSQEDGGELGNALMTGILPALKTPRQVKIFENAITFAVPLLKGEVRLIDQIRIEALRVFYPKLYDAVRQRPDDVLRGKERQARDMESSTKIEEAINESDLDPQARFFLTDFLRELFPRFGSNGYGDGWENSWAKSKRICSRSYFSRYFT